MPRAGTGTVAQGRLAGVDGLRACAAFSVLAYHVALAGSLVTVGPGAPLFAELKGGVATFFVISGFLLYRPYAAAIFGSAALPSWRSYLEHRALRIVPAYWVALTLLALGPLHQTLVSPQAWRYYGFGQIYASSTVLNGLGVAWSLCVEVSFYFVLPLFAWALARRLRGRDPARAASRQLRVLALLGAGALLLRLTVTHSLTAEVPDGASVLETALPGFLDWFAAGMGLAVLSVAWARGERPLWRLHGLARRTGACWALAAACFALSAAVQPEDLFLPLYGVAGHLATGLGSALLVLPAAAASRPARRRGIARALEHRWAVWLGTISYGVYLWQVPVLQALAGRRPPNPGTPAGLGHTFALLALVLLGSVAIGAASWYAVEQPSRRRLSRPAPRPLAAARAAKPV